MRHERQGCPAKDATMAEWVIQLQRLSPMQSEFAQTLLLEEAQKVERLARIAREIGLPIYESSRFKLLRKI